MLRSLKDILKFLQVLIDDSFAATAATTGVDLADFNSMSWVVSVGAFVFTGVNKVSITVQHSDTDSGYVNAGAADIYNAEDGDNGIAKILDDTTDQSKVHMVHYRGNKRFARLNLVMAGVVTGVPIDVVAVRGNSELMPPL